MDRDLAIDFEHAGVEHDHLPDGNFVPDDVTVLVFAVFVGKGSDKHDGAALGVSWYFDFSILVSDVSILCKFMKLDVLFGIVNKLDVLFYFLFIVPDIVFENEVYEPVTHGCLSQN